MSELTDADDVLPEAEDYQSASLDDYTFQAEQKRGIEEQNILRARCIENGEDARKFLATNFGQYLLGQAELEAGFAKESLCDVDADDTKKIRVLQAQIKRSRDLEGWIKSAMDKSDQEYSNYLLSMGIDED